MSSSRMLILIGIMLIALVGLASATVLQQDVIQQLKEQGTRTENKTFFQAISFIVTTIIPYRELSSPVAVSTSDFLGSWHNVDPNTVGFRIMNIVRRHNCNVLPCPAPFMIYFGLDSSLLYFYSDSILGSNVYYASSVFIYGFGTEYVTLQFITANQLAVFTLTHFTDNSGRVDYYMTDIMAHD